MPRLASIIPVLGSTEGLETTLLSVLERRPTDCDVLVALNVRYDDPYHLQDEVRFVEAPAGAGLVACLNAGIAATQAPVVHLLSPGFEATDEWAERALEHFDDPRVAAVAPAIYDSGDRASLSATGVGYLRGGRRLVCRHEPDHDISLGAWVGPLLHAAFYRKSALDALGTQLPSDVGDELADVDLALLLRQAGWKIHFEPDCRIYAPPIEDGTPGGWRWGLWSERLFWRHWAHGSRIGSLISHPAAALTDIAGSTPWRAPAQWLGRVAATLQWGHYGHYRQTIKAAKLEAAVAHGEWESLEMQSASSRHEQWDGHSDAATEKARLLRIDVAHPQIKPSSEQKQTRIRHA